MRTTEKNIVDSPVMERILNTLRVRNLTQKQLIEYLGLPNGTFTSWKYNGGKSYMKYIDGISEFLNIPKEYLLYGDPSSDDTALLLSDVEDYKKFRQLSDEQQCLIRTAIDIIWRANNGL
jgi:transcriptional regulator with XRE-family HTH domain